MFRIEIETDNAAFADHAPSEVSRILRDLAVKLEYWPDLPAHFLLYDLNGNKVGFAQEESDEPEQETCWAHRQPIERCPIQCRGR